MTRPDPLASALDQEFWTSPPASEAAPSIRSHLRERGVYLVTAERLAAALHATDANTRKWDAGCPSCMQRATNILTALAAEASEP